jgi:hypothetical protein
MDATSSAQMPAPTCAQKLAATAMSDALAHRLRCMAELRDRRMIE